MHTSQQILHFFLKSAIRRGLLIIFLIGGSIVSIVELLPKMEYLPQGNRNLIFNILIPPPGLSYREKKQIGETIFKKIKPHMGNAIGKYPAIARAFYVAGGDFMIFGVISADDRRVSVFKSLLQPIANSFPGIFGITIQAGVFDDDLGKGRNIDVDISGKNIEKLADIGSSLFGTISSQIPESQIHLIKYIESFGFKVKWERTEGKFKEMIFLKYSVFSAHLIAQHHIYFNHFLILKMYGKIMPC